MVQFKFLGNPADYRWDFPLEKDKVYSGDTVAFDGNTIADVMDWTEPNDEEFLEEWKEVGNG